MANLLDEQFPTCKDLIPGCAQQAIDEAKWFVLWFSRGEVFAATHQHAIDNRIWYGQTLQLEWNDTYDLCETSLGTTYLQNLLDANQCEITADIEEVVKFFDKLRAKRNANQTKLF